jgi:hypothetical protein
MSRELKEIIKEIKETEKTAIIRLDEVPYKNRGGMGIAIRTACERLPVLLDELAKAVIPSRLTAVYATGDEAIVTKVADFMRKNGGIVLDGNELYRNICKDIEPTYDNMHTFSTTQHGIMLNGIREIARSLDYAELPAPTYKETICKTPQDTINHVRSLIRGSMGDTLSKKYLVKSLTDLVLKTATDVPRIPILVVDVPTPEEKANLSTLFTTNTDYKFSPDFIITSKTLSKIFKGSQNGNNATTGEESKEGE